MNFFQVLMLGNKSMVFLVGKMPNNTNQPDPFFVRATHEK